MLAPYSGITINAARRLLMRSFETSGLLAPEIDAKILVGFAANMSASDLIACGTDFLTPEQFECVSDYAARRLGGEPVSQIIGRREFWKDSFRVTRDVLTPRPETEGLIESALERFGKHQEIDILDLGTGSGAIILSLLGEFVGARGTGTDISQDALAVARDNAVCLKRDCHFIESCWFQAVKGPFDLIVSNPPYITNDEMAELPRDVSEFEPHIALYGGEDGADPYRVIAADIGGFLKPGGWAVFEIGSLQGKIVSQILQESGLRNISVSRDLGGLDRVVCAQK